MREVALGDSRITVIRGDITALGRHVGAIVNALKTVSTTDAQNDRFARLLPRAQAHMKKNVEVSRRLKGP